MLIILTLSMVRVFLADSEPDSELLVYHGRRVLTVEGTITSDPQAAGGASRFRIAVRRVSDGPLAAEASGAVLVTANAPIDLARLRDRPHFRYGDRLMLTGRPGSAARRRRVRLPGPPGAAGYRHGDVVSRSGPADRRPGQRLLPAALRRSAADRRLAGGGRSGARGVGRPSAAAGNQRRHPRLPINRIQDHRGGAHTGGLRVARWRAAGDQPGGKPGPAGPPSKSVSPRAPGDPLALRSDYGHVSLGDAGGHHGKRIPGRTLLRAPQERAAGAVPCGGGDGGRQPSSAVERVVPAQLHGRSRHCPILGAVEPAAELPLGSPIRPRRGIAPGRRLHRRVGRRGRGRHGRHTPADRVLLSDPSARRPAGDPSWSSPRCPSRSPPRPWPASWGC